MVGIFFFFFTLFKAITQKRLAICWFSKTASSVKCFTDCSEGPVFPKTVDY